MSIVERHSLDSALARWEGRFLRLAAVAVVCTMFGLTVSAGFPWAGIVVCLAAFLYLASAAAGVRWRGAAARGERRRRALKRLQGIGAGDAVKAALEDCAAALQSGRVIIASYHARTAVQEWARERGFLSKERTVETLLSDEKDGPLELRRLREAILSAVPSEALFELWDAEPDVEGHVLKTHALRLVKAVWVIVVDPDDLLPEISGDIT